MAPESEIAEDLLAAGVIGGVPAIAGAWLGGLAVSLMWGTLFLAVGAGAISDLPDGVANRTGDVRDRAAGYRLTPPVSGLRGLVFLGTVAEFAYDDP